MYKLSSKNSNIAILVVITNVITISQHIQNTRIFNAWGIFKTL